MNKRTLFIPIAFGLCLLLAACSKHSSSEESTKEQTSSNTQVEQSTKVNSTSDSSFAETSSESELVSSDAETVLPETESVETILDENTEYSTENIPESVPQSRSEENSPEESSPLETVTDESLPPANNILEVSVEVTENGIILTTSCFSITLPADWEGNYISGIRALDGYGYSLSLYEKLSYDAYPGQGLLFSIDLRADDSYTVFPDYDVIGTLDIVRLNQFDVVAVYPSDVQFAMDPNAITLYQKMYSDISSILDSFTPSADATFTAK